MILLSFLKFHRKLHLQQILPGLRAQEPLLVQPVEVQTLEQLVVVEQPVVFVEVRPV